ncbi:MAG: GumC family protein [Beijerinckiaceae bacterium]
MFQYDSKNVAEPASVRVAANAGFGLADIPGALWRRKFLILTLPILFALAAAAYTTLLRNQYFSAAQILVDPRELRVLATDVSPSGLNSDSITAYIESQSRIILSADMLKRIVDRERLTKDTEFASPSGVLARLIPQSSGGDETLRVSEVLRRKMSVRRGDRTFIIDVGVTTETPEKSARLANAFAAAFLEDQTNARSEQARRASTAITARLNELRDRVRKSEDAVESYKNQKNIVGASGKLVTEEQLAAVNSQLAFARSRTADSKAKMEQIDSVRGQTLERGSIPEAVNSQTLGLLRQQLGEAQRRAVSLSTSLGPMHPEYLAAQSTLRDAQRAVGEEIGRIRTAAKAEFERSQSNEKTLAAQVDILKKQTLDGGRDNVELRERERELEANRGIYQAFLQRARETGEQERLDTSNARIITTAFPPLERVGPQRRLIVTVAALAGLMLGILIALVRAIMESGVFRKPDYSQDVVANIEEPLPATQSAMTPSASAMSAATITQPSPQYAQPQQQPSPAPTAPQAMQQPSSQEDLLRMLRMLGQLEKAIDRYGIPR